MYNSSAQDSPAVADEYGRLSERVRIWVETALGPNARVQAATVLSGGLTADMDRLIVAVAGRQLDVVLRRWSDHEWGPGLVDREAAGLEALASHDLPVPRLLAADHSGEEAGEPCLLMTALPGDPAFNPSDLPVFVDELASTLVRLHDIDPAGLAATDPHGFDQRRVHAWIGDPALAQAVIEAADGSGGRLETVLVHGDYHPLNMLWQGRRLSGVVDWAYVGGGRREIDVGLCRLSLAVLFSAATAEAFLNRYEAEAGRQVDPHADIRSLLAFEPGWLEFLSRQVARSEPFERRRMIDQVHTVLRTAVGRLA